MKIMTLIMMMIMMSSSPLRGADSSQHKRPVARPRAATGRPGENPTSPSYLVPFNQLCLGHLISAEQVASPC